MKNIGLISAELYVLQQSFSYLQRGPAVLLQCWCVQLAIAAPGEDCNLPPGETEMQRGAAAVKYEGHKSPEHETWGRAADCRQNTGGNMPASSALMRILHQKLSSYWLQVTYRDIVHRKCIKIDNTNLPK